MDSAIKKIFDLAIAAYEAGGLEQAKKLFNVVAQASPSDPDSYSFLGIIAIKEDQPGIAAHYFLEASRLNPEIALHHANLSGALLQIKLPEEALSAARRALELEPDYPAALLNSGIALLSLKKIDEGKDQLKRLLSIYPDQIALLDTFASNMMKLKDFAEAERLLRLAASLCPEKIDILLNLGSCLQQTYRNKEAIEVYESILKIDPKHIPARLLLCNACLLHIYKDEKEIALARSRYSRELLALRDLCMQSSSAELSSALPYLGASQPFLLPYQGQNDHDLQTIYGEIVAQIIKACYPDQKEKLSSQKHTGRDRIRVGIVSGFFKYHSIWKTHISGLVKQINRKDFAVYGYHTGLEYDDITREAELHLEKFTFGLKTCKEYRTAIKDHHPDVLIYPEIGMDPLSMRLAAMRLAPVQCNYGGHPATSGLQTIDFFLSSELMEPKDGAAFYTEKLICLPNLSFFYEPLPIVPSKRSRCDFCLTEDAVLFWCCQVPIKYHPRYDKVLVKIASAVPNAKLVFIESVPLLARQFRERLEIAFSSFGLEAKNHCIFLPKLYGDEFGEAAHLMDVYLDSLGWSGCNTSLESLAHNLPLVTFPGATMRSRHTAAILTMMDMEDCIAASEENYITRAVGLGCNPEERIRMRRRIEGQKQRVYRNKTAIIALENFLKKAVDGS